jgi:prophage antirepressor-like protein
MTVPSSQTFFTASDLARLLGLSQQRVSQLIAAGKIEAPSVRVGRTHGFSPDQAFRITQARREQGWRWEPTSRESSD